MERFKVGIIGAGHIARKMAHTLRDMEGVEPYAVASRNQENAEGFACEWGFTRAYGSYEDLADDPEVQLIYIATPHSHHFEQARMCLERVSRSYVKSIYRQCRAGRDVDTPVERKTGFPD